MRELIEWRHRRGVPRDIDDEKFWDRGQVLLESQHLRLKSYMKMRDDLVKADKLSEDQDCIFDLDQNPSSGRWRFMSERSA